MVVLRGGELLLVVARGGRAAGALVAEHADLGAPRLCADVVYRGQEGVRIGGEGRHFELVDSSLDLVEWCHHHGALYLDTQESRGLVPGTHPSFVGAVRARAMKEADLVIAIYNPASKTRREQLGQSHLDLLRLDGQTNIAAANRHHARDPQRTLKLLQAA